jgi:hypothetical protein
MVGIVPFKVSFALRVCKVNTYYFIMFSVEFVYNSNQVRHRIENIFESCSQCFRHLQFWEFATVSYCHY